MGCSRSQVRGTVPRVSRAPLGSRDRGEAARRSSLSIAACSYLLALSHVDLRFLGLSVRVSGPIESCHVP